MAKPIYVLNGPNLNLLGLRQPEIYGKETLADVAAALSDLADDLGLTVRCLQSNHEGQLIDWIHEARGEGAGIIINPGAYTHTSVAIFDALSAFGDENFAAELASQLSELGGSTRMQTKLVGHNDVKFRHIENNVKEVGSRRYVSVYTQHSLRGASECFIGHDIQCCIAIIKRF